MIKNDAVARAWAENQAGDSKNLHTDGKDLYSYNLLIGYTTSDGKKIVRNYRSGGEWGHVSHTTSRHVTMAMIAAKS